VALSSGEEVHSELLDRADHVMLGGKKKGKGRIFMT
jgi:hypothetical protein